MRWLLHYRLDGYDAHLYNDENWFIFSVRSSGKGMIEPMVTHSDLLLKGWKVCLGENYGI